MNTLKKKLVAGGVALVLATTAVGTFAKGGPDKEGERRGGMNLDYIFTQLELTDEQRTEVQEVMTAFREQAREERAAEREARKNSEEEKPSQEEREAMREEAKAAMLVALTDQLNTVLAADDTAELIDYLEAHAGDHKGDKRGGKRGGFDKDSTVDESK